MKTKETEIKIVKPASGFTFIPQYVPSFEEQANLMRINADLIKQEITDHVTKEIERLENHFKLANIKFERKND